MHLHRELSLFFFYKVTAHVFFGTAGHPLHIYCMTVFLDKGYFFRANGIFLPDLSSKKQSVKHMTYDIHVNNPCAGF